jgi:peptidyl-tRNA hydrolase, PTH1 family
MPKPISLLITSIGNPTPQYANTLHSAGHTLLQNLRTLLPTYEPWSPHLGGQISRPPAQIKRFALTGYKNIAEEYPTLWMSGSYMNVSGPAVKKAWEGWKGGKDGAKLIVVHDELEKEIGKIGVKMDGKSSAK